MKEIFENQPLSSEAPQGLRNKVEFASRQRARKEWFGPRVRLAAASTVVVAAAIGGVMFMTPATAEAKTWDMVTSAYQQVRGVLIEMSFDGQGEHGSLIVAGKGKDWRVQVEGLDAGKDARMDVSYSNGKLTMWDGGDTAQVIDLGFDIPFTPEQVMQGIAEELSASKILGEHSDEIGKENIRIEQPEWVGNRRVYNVYITSPHGEGDASNVHILVDADTDLPINMTVSGERGEAMTMKFQFDADFDSSLLYPTIPSGVKIEKLDSTKMLNGGDHDFFEGIEHFGKGMERAHREERVEVDRAVLRG